MYEWEGMYGGRDFCREGGREGLEGRSYLYNERVKFRFGGWEGMDGG